MEKTPKSLRLHIGIFGRTNVGKSSFLNLIAGQDVAITSPVPGTTTDVVEKPMELLPLGPVVFLDTAGIDDNSELGKLRVQRTKRVFERAEVAVLVAESGVWGEYEDSIAAMAKERNLPLIAVLNKSDIKQPDAAYTETVKNHTEKFFPCDSTNAAGREKYRNEFKRLLISCAPEEFVAPPRLVGDLVRPGGIAMLVVPIDLQAPKGRLILPQVQTIRDALDNDSMCLVVKEREYAHALSLLKDPPDITVCDSQSVLKVTADTPANVKCTTFSILFARMKGDLATMAAGAAAIDSLKAGDKVLIAESCSHHPAEDDIGRVKIPRWLRQYTGVALDIRTACGLDFPENVSDCKLIIHCGACMTNRRDMLWRMEKAKEAGVAITNYGVAISFLQGVLKRTLAPFPAALAAFESAKSLKQ
jgi:[FeFe] hydrogenase H-cluster maturation GTPase HydF